MKIVDKNDIMWQSSNIYSYYLNGTYQQQAGDQYNFLLLFFNIKKSTNHLF